MAVDRAYRVPPRERSERAPAREAAPGRRPLHEQREAPRAAGAVVFRRSERGIRLLLLRAYQNWDFPKGLVEPGENELDACKREVEEETGLSDLDYPFGDEHKETLPYSGNKVA